DAVPVDGGDRGADRRRGSRPDRVPRHRPAGRRPRRARRHRHRAAGDHARSHHSGARRPRRPAAGGRAPARARRAVQVAAHRIGGADRIRAAPATQGPRLALPRPAILPLPARGARTTNQRRTTMPRARAFCLRATVALGALILPLGAAEAQQPGEGKTVQPARPTWDTGWFTTAIYGKLLEELGYEVAAPTTLDNPVFYQAVAQGDA